MSRSLPTARRMLAFAVVAAALGATPHGVAHAQDPVVKPTLTLSRLPAPGTIRAAQQPDGRIRVAWAPVEGAVKYTLTRSVPNLSNGVVALPNPTDTVYVDSDVRAGYSYYYAVTAVDGSGATGLKRASTPVVATLTAQPAATAGPTVTAVVTSTRSTGVDIKVSWPPVSRATGYTFHSIALLPLASDPSQPDPASGKLYTPITLNSMQTTQLAGASFGSVNVWMVYRVTPILPGGVMGTPGESAPILVPKATTTSTPIVTTTAGTPVSASLSVSVAVGGTSALAAQTAIVNGQWLSMDPAVATVSSDGTVTGRAAGTASVVSVVPQTNGPVLVKVVRVTVTTQAAPTSPPD